MSTYAPAQSASKLSFLDLPYNVRHRVYVLAGLVRFCPIDLNLEYSQPAAAQEEYEHERENEFEYSRENGETMPVEPNFNAIAFYLCVYRQRRFFDDTWDQISDESGSDLYCLCAFNSLPYNLLYVSRAVHDEVSSILYSENQFKICRSAPRGLSPFLNLSARALASLTSLSVRLNVCSRIPRYYGQGFREIEPQSWNESHEKREMAPDKPLGPIVSRDDKLLLSEWTEVCNRIVAHGTSRLRLSLICETSNLETARKITQPLKMVAVGRCSIRLGQERNPELMNLARASALQAMKVPNEQPFRFADLPAEIQDQVLCYTDLVAPDELEWSPDIGLSLWRQSDRKIQHCCKTCTDALEACHCPTQHAAFSPSCACWSFPLSIFRTSRRVNLAATRIFYSQNHFLVDCGLRPRSWPDLEISLFLRRLPAQALPHLRSISLLIFNSDLGGPTYIPLPASIASDWRQTIIFMASNLELGRLNLTLDMSAWRGSSAAAQPNQPPESVERAVWDRYARMVEPLTLLKQIQPERKGLKNLFIHVSWPFRVTGQEVLEQWAPQRLVGCGWDAISREKPGSVEKRDEWAQILERHVMGPDYDSFAQGKPRGFSLDEIMNPFLQGGGDGSMHYVKYVRRWEQMSVLGPDGAKVWPVRDLQRGWDGGPR